MMREFDTADAGFAEDFAALLAARRAVTVRVGGVVAEILAEVKARGDDALLEFTRRFDRLSLGETAALRIGEDEIEKAVATLDPRLLQALDLAASRIEAFHRAQLPADLALHDSAGMTLGLRWTPLDAVGLYVPGGKAAYPSSVLMNALPARIAGVKRIAMCVPTPDGLLNPLVLAAAKRAALGCARPSGAGRARRIGTSHFDNEGPRFRPGGNRRHYGGVGKPAAGGDRTGEPANERGDYFGARLGGGRRAGQSAGSRTCGNYAA